VQSASRGKEPTGNQNLFGAEPISKQAQQQATAQPRQALDTIDADGSHRRHAEEDGVTYHMKDRSRVGRAAREESQCENQELRRAEGLRSGHAPPSAASPDVVSLVAVAGSNNVRARMPIDSIAVRQS
jgi:hypothetical protein